MMIGHKFGHFKNPPFISPAGLSAIKGISPINLDVNELQEKLLNDGVLLRPRSDPL